ncbi:MAG: YheT family hydrolase, partial [Pyrinomonadaceae bacterium]
MISATNATDLSPELTEEPGGDAVAARMEVIRRELAQKHFRPYRLLRNKHAQTLGGYAWPRRFRLRALRRDEARLFEVEPGVRLLVHCRWHGGVGDADHRRERPTLLLVHGLEGSSTSVYMLSTAHKAFRAGFNVLRLNVRTCGGSERFSQTSYNGSMSQDLRAVVDELIARDRLKSIYLAGFSLGGNMSLKMAGEAGAGAPPELRGLCAVSPSIDLSACATAIAHRSNWFYGRKFLMSLKQRVRLLQQTYPDRYDASELERVSTIREFDARFTV